MGKSIVLLIESGLALDLVKQHIAEVQRVRLLNQSICEELGVKEGVTDPFSGVLRGVVFTGTIHKDWSVPKRNRCSYPKKGTPWSQRILDQRGYADPSATIAEAFGVPTETEYKRSSDGCHGSRSIGNMLHPCGFLYLSKDGPYAMWIPDAEAEVRDDEARGYVVAEPTKSYRPAIDGCRRIEVEEWEILVAQHKLAKKAGLAHADTQMIKNP